MCKSVPSLGCILSRICHLEVFFSHDIFKLCFGLSSCGPVHIICMQAKSCSPAVECINRTNNNQHSHSIEADEVSQQRTSNRLGSHSSKHGPANCSHSSSFFFYFQPSRALHHGVLQGRLLPWHNEDSMQTPP